MRHRPPTSGCVDYSALWAPIDPAAPSFAHEAHDTAAGSKTVQWLLAHPVECAPSSRAGAGALSAPSGQGGIAPAPPRPKVASPSLDSSTLKRHVPSALRGLVGDGHVRVTGLWNVTATEYPDGWKAVVYQGHDPPKVGGERVAQVKDDSARFESSVIRAKARVRHLMRCIGADHLWTFTKRGKFGSLDELWSVWKEFDRLMAVRYPQRPWVRVAVPELHGDGETWHLHVGCRGLWDVNTLRHLWHRALGAPGLMHGVESPGNVDVQDKRHCGRSARSIASYIAKYVGKGMGRVESGRRLYAPTKGIVPLKRHHFHFVTAVTAHEMHELVSACLLEWGARADFECFRYGEGVAECYVFEG